MPCLPQSQNYQLALTANNKLDKNPDCLSLHHGVSFSTYDRDNDDDDVINCAARHAGGWWFLKGTCSTLCNPMGQLVASEDGNKTGQHSEAFWQQWAPVSIKAYLINQSP